MEDIFKDMDKQTNKFFKQADEFIAKMKKERLSTCCGAPPLENSERCSECKDNADYKYEVINY